MELPLNSFGRLYWAVLEPSWLTRGSIGDLQSQKTRKPSVYSEVSEVYLFYHGRALEVVEGQFFFFIRLLWSLEGPYSFGDLSHSIATAMLQQQRQQQRQRQRQQQGQR